jgi:hypothetical protein
MPNEERDTSPKLTLRRESLRTLDDADLERVSGGAAAMYTQAGHQCDTTICDDETVNAAGGGEGGGGLIG